VCAAISAVESSVILVTEFSTPPAMAGVPLGRFSRSIGWF
jgi:hypothetical protein